MAEAHSKNHDYHLVDPSPWPFLASVGAFFMATDMVTAPITLKGQMIFALGCGLITVLIRTLGGYPEGVCYSILLMNTLTPLIDRLVKPTVFGAVKTKGAK